MVLMMMIGCMFSSSEFITLTKLYDWNCLNCNKMMGEEYAFEGQFSVDVSDMYSPFSSIFYFKRVFLISNDLIYDSTEKNLFF